jgi:PAS domain S-box-containing protein
MAPDGQARDNRISEPEILSAILKSLPSLVSYIDRDLVYRYVNDAYLTWFGLSSEQCLGKPCTEILGTEAVNSLQDLLIRVWAGETIHQEREVTYKLGGKKWVQVNYVPDIDTQGVVQGVFVITHDFSNLDRARKSAEKKSAEFERMINSVNSIIAQWDTNLKCVAANNAFQEVFGIDPALAKGRPIKDFIGEDAFTANQENFKRVLSGETVTFERDFPESSPRWRSRFGTYTPNIINGQVEGFFAVITDITEVKAQAEKIAEQKSYYLGILDSMVEGYVVQDSASEILSFNQAACKILGLTEDQLTGRTSMDPDWQSIHEDGSPFPGSEHPAPTTIKTGKAVTNVLMGIKTPKQVTRWLKVNAVPFQALVNGKIASVLCTFSDVTEEVQRQKLTAAIIQNSPGGIYQLRLTASGNLSFDYTSEKVFSIFRITAGDFQRNSNILKDLVEPEDQISLGLAIQESAKNLSPFKWRGRIRSGAGEVVWIHAQSLPHLNADKEVVWDGIFMDISHEVLLENRLSEEQNKAAHAAKLASLGELSAGLAHEINNPLQLINGLCSILMHRAPDDEIVKKSVAKIENTVFKISKIVNGLKRFSRQATKGIRTLHTLSTVLAEAQTLAEMKAKKNRIEIRCKINSSAQVLCDPDEIEQVIVNLLNNALDAVENLAEKWVELQCFDEDTQVVIRIVDSGKGIPDSVLNKLFSPFFTTKPFGQGTGLGLGIALGIVKDHLGILQVLRDYPNTCFELRLPKAQVLPNRLAG